VIAGMNLPMLIKLASVRNTEKLEDAVVSAREAGRKYINVASNCSPAPRVTAERRAPSRSATKGLHARAAAKFVKLASSFNAQVRVIKGEMDVSGTSIMGLMMLAAGLGSQIALKAEGAEAASAIRALIDLIERKFDEE
jgi:phosphocarrier protein